jgi:hypothetical protein
MERCPSPPEITSRGCRALSRQRTARDAAMTRIGGPYSRRWPHLAREGRIVSKHRIAAVLIGSDPFFDSRRDQLVAGDTGDRGSSTAHRPMATRLLRGGFREGLRDTGIDVLVANRNIACQGGSAGDLLPRTRQRLTCAVCFSTLTGRIAAERHHVGGAGHVRHSGSVR